ncbi:hypothetical protein FACS1894186_8410 [Alphaproteobacteria bacterium]|nr:hypothetical protein FACS1894186_8410 [Alphaproteobacteria bacterium]
MYCSADPEKRLTLLVREMPQLSGGRSRYMPVSRRSDRPSAIMWLLKNCPDMSASAICRLIGTTKPTVDSIREKTHKDFANIRPANPITLGLCTQEDLDKAMTVAAARAGKKDKEEQTPKED